jgi:hypothetical protein
MFQDTDIIIMISKGKLNKFLKKILIKKEAAALRKMIQDIASLKHSSILYLVYVLLSATTPQLAIPPIIPDAVHRISVVANLDISILIPL